MPQNAITVTAVPGASTAILLEDGATVAQAVSQAGLSTEGMRVALNGEVVTDFTTPVRHGDRITIARQVKGNV